MELWLWILIGIFIFVFLIVAVMIIKDEGFKEFWTNIHLVILLSLALEIILPIIVLMSIYMFIKLYIDKPSKSNNTVEYTKFNIPILTEGIKEALRQIGFNEGKHYSYYGNKEYEGFIYGNIEIALDGRCIVYGHPSKDSQRIIDTLKAIKNPDDVRVQLENRIKNNQKYVSDTKKTIKDLEKELEKLKETE